MIFFSFSLRLIHLDGIPEISIGRLTTRSRRAFPDPIGDRDEKNSSALLLLLLYIFYLTGIPLCHIENLFHLLRCETVYNQVGKVSRSRVKLYLFLSAPRRQM